MRVLIAYGTSHGSTADIATHIADRLHEHGCEVFTAGVHALPRGFVADRYDAILIGGRVWGNRYPRALARFVRDHLAAITSRPSGFFSVNLWSVSRIDAHRAEAREVPRRFLEGVDWKPDKVEVIAGTLAFSKYFGGFAGRLLMQSIWKGDFGRLDMGRDHCFTDWRRVDAFADEFYRLVARPDHHQMPPSAYSHSRNATMR